MERVATARIDSDAFALLETDEGLLVARLSAVRVRGTALVLQFTYRAKRDVIIQRWRVSSEVVTFDNDGTRWHDERSRLRSGDMFTVSWRLETKAPRRRSGGLCGLRRG